LLDREVRILVENVVNTEAGPRVLNDQAYRHPAVADARITTTHAGGLVHEWVGVIRHIVGV